MVESGSSQVHKRVSANHLKLAQVPGVLEEVLIQAREVTEAIADLGHILSDGSVAILAVGQSAYVEQRLLPRDIVERYWPVSRSWKRRALVE